MHVNLPLTTIHQPEANVSTWTGEQTVVAKCFMVAKSIHKNNRRASIRHIANPREGLTMAGAFGQLTGWVHETIARDPILTLGLKL